MQLKTSNDFGSIKIFFSKLMNIGKCTINMRKKYKYFSLSKLI